MNAKVLTGPGKAGDDGGHKSLKQLRRERRRSLQRKLLAWVGGPTLLAAAYFVGLASDQFESTAKFAVHSSDRSAPVGLEMFMGAGGGGSSTHDTLSVRDYILSRDLLARLDAEHGFSAHYAKRELDLWARLAADADLEERFEFYLDRVEISHDTLSGNLTLRVRAFSPEAAERFASAIMAYSEEMVNRMSERSRNDQISFAREQVAAAEERLRASSVAISQLQAQRGELDPQQSAAAVVGIRSELEIELAKARAELAQVRAIYQPGAAKVLEAKRRVNALRGQIERENERLVATRPAESDERDDSLRESLMAFQQVSLEQEFARAAYHSSLTSLETARAQANQQQRYLAAIAKPSKPDAPTHPRKLLAVFTVLVCSFALFSIFSLLGASVREHARL